MSVPIKQVAWGDKQTLALLRTRVWERFYVAISRTRGFTDPKSESADIARKRRSTARLPTDARPNSRVLHATVPSSSGPARKHTAKFEQGRA
eukprot:scaffold27370_cov52-Phaeocystis_antarctica.AAC.1